MKVSRQQLATQLGQIREGLLDLNAGLTHIDVNTTNQAVPLISLNYEQRNIQQPSTTEIELTRLISSQFPKEPKLLVAHDFVSVVMPGGEKTRFQIVGLALHVHRDGYLEEELKLKGPIEGEPGSVSAILDLEHVRYGPKTTWNEDIPYQRPLKEEIIPDEPGLEDEEELDLGTELGT